MHVFNNRDMFLSANYGSVNCVDYCIKDILILKYKGKIFCIALNYEGYMERQE